MKRKLTFSIPVAAATGVLSATSGLSVTILKHGAQFAGAETITASTNPMDLSLFSLGGIAADSDSEMVVVKADNSVHETFQIVTKGVADAAGGVTLTTVTGAGAASIEAAKDDWLCFDYAVAAGEASLYEGPTSTTAVTDNPLTIGTDFMVEVWTDEPIVDIYVAGGSITNRYFIGIKTEEASVINVKDFGAVDSLTVDSTAAVQSAIDYAGANDGVLYFPKGDYRIESALTYDGSGSAGLTLKGVGPELSRFIVIGDIDCLSLVDTWGVVIDGIDFHHAGTNPTAESRMILLDGCNRTRIQNCLFTNCWTAIRTGKATSSTKTQNVFITDCQVDIGHGESHATQIIFNITDTIGFVMENTLISWGSATIDAGISVDDGVDTLALTNVACTGTGPGIGFRTISSLGGSDHECRWIRLANSYFEGGTDQAAYLTAGYDMAFNGCYFVQGLHGVHVNGAEDVRVVGCLVRENDESGIKIESGDKVVIADNTVARNSAVTGAAAITVAAGVGGRITGNFVGKTHSGGTTVHTIGIHLGADEWICSGNEVSGGSSHGINVDADRCVVTGNICKDNTGYAVAIQAGATDTILTSNQSDTNTAGDWSDGGTTTSHNNNIPSLGHSTVTVPFSKSMFLDSNQKNLDLNWLGYFNLLATAGDLDSGDITPTGGLGKLLLVVNTAADSAGTVRITGTTVDRSTGAETGADTEDIVIAGLTTDGSDTDAESNVRHSFTNAYLTTKWFKGQVTISEDPAADTTITDIDVYQVAFHQFNDSPGITVDTLDFTGFSGGATSWVYVYLYSVIPGAGGTCAITREASLELPATDVSASEIYRLRKSSIALSLDGSMDGVWVDLHLGPAATTGAWESVTAYLEGSQEVQ